MPSGKHINWAEHDKTIRLFLPSLTIDEFTKIYLPTISPKAVGARARLLMVKPAKHQLTEAHRNKISSFVSKETPELVERLRVLRPKMSLRQLKYEVGLSTPTIIKICQKHSIPPGTPEIKSHKQFKPKDVASYVARHDDVIRSELPKCTVNELANRLAMNPKTLGRRARQLGIKPCQYRPTKEHRQKISISTSRVWSDAETDFLLDNIAILSIKEISKKLNINASNVWRKLHQLHCVDFGNVTTKHRRRVVEALSTPEARQRLSAASTGKVLSDEQKLKISESLKQRWDDPQTRQMYLTYRRSSEVKHKLALAMANQPRISKPQELLYTHLDNLGVQYLRESNETRVGYFVFDCRIPRPNNKDILIEVQGDYWHTRADTTRRDKAKFTYIDRYFADQFEIMYVWEYEFTNKGRLLDRLARKLGISGRTIDFDFKDLVVSEAPYEQIKSFLDAYHYLGDGRGGKAIGCFLAEELIAVILFSSPSRHNINFGCPFLEVSRFCIDPAHHKQNFASWFLSRSLKFIDIPLVVAYADKTVGHLGTIYKASNFIFHHETKPDYWYVGPDNYIMHKHTLYARAKKALQCESVYALEHGFIKKFGGPKLCFIKHLI